MYTLIELETKTTEWADERGIIKNGKPTTQALKLVEELGELAAAILRGKLPEAKDGIGDCCVVLNNVAQQLGSSVTECWNLAYEEIKDRKGYLTPEGNFIKESDNAKPEPIIKAADYMEDKDNGLTAIYFTLDTKEVKVLIITKDSGYNLGWAELIGFTLEEAINYLKLKGYSYV